LTVPSAEMAKSEVPAPTSTKAILSIRMVGGTTTCMAAMGSKVRESIPKPARSRAVLRESMTMRGRKVAITSTWAVDP